MARIYIGVGSNIDREVHLRAGWQSLQTVFGPLTCSTVYESDAVGFAGSAFYNLVIGAETGMSVAEVCSALREIEFRHGRPQQARKFSSRTLDLDLLCYDQLVLTTPVVLPRAEILLNAFVLRPLSELCPDYCHPVVGETLAALWQRYDASQQPLRAVDFSWPSA